MKKVQQTVGRWVRRIAGKARAEKPAQQIRVPVELDARTLGQVGGGVDEPQLPVKGW